MNCFAGNSPISIYISINIEEGLSLVIIFCDDYFPRVCRDTYDITVLQNTHMCLPKVLCIVLLTPIVQCIINLNVPH